MLRLLKILPLLLAFGVGVHAASAETLCHIESDFNVESDQCGGEMLGGLCSEDFYKDIIFKRAFSAPPHVLVTAERISSQSGCVLRETDVIHCYPETIRADGFRLRCSGSPIAQACGDLNEHRTRATAQWIAIDPSPACGGESAHLLRPEQCVRRTSPESCAETYYEDVRLKRPASAPPKVLLSAERLGDKSLCAIEGIDNLTCAPSDIKPTSFRIHCAGSMYASTCPMAGDSGYTPGEVGYLSFQDRESCPALASHGLAATICNGQMEGELCTGELYMDVTFPRPFAEPPHLIVSSEAASSGPPCGGSAMDGMYCYARQITEKGFRAFCGASPLLDTCNARPGSGSLKASFGYLAVSKTCAPG